MGGLVTLHNRVTHGISKTIINKRHLFIKVFFNNSSPLVVENEDETKSDDNNTSTLMPPSFTLILAKGGIDLASIKKDTGLDIVLVFVQLITEIIEELGSNREEKARLYIASYVGILMIVKQTYPNNLQFVSNFSRRKTLKHKFS